MSNVRPEFEFLNRLCEDGSVNMFGASQPLAAMFDLRPREASKILVEWMQWVDENPSNRDL